MSSFTPKRKAKVIKVRDDDEEDAPAASPTAADPVKDEGVQVPVKFTRKPFRQSGLRKSINFNELDDPTGAAATSNSAKSKTSTQEEEDDDGPVVIRPTISRSGSLKQKKRKSTSRLSFGGAQDGGNDNESNAEFTTPKKTTLGYQAFENSAVKNRLPMRTFRDEDEDRPKYSKEYLDELQNSTPSTPQNISAAHPQHEDEEMGLDPSELEGAVIVNSDDFGARPQQTSILTETEIQERKQRRARLAQEEQADDFISFDDAGDNSLRRKKADTRLVPEDEDLGEGFDDFVEDGGLSLGRKAEKEEKLRKRREMAEQIKMAEGDSDSESDASEAERRAAFEAAQTRSGMDGLQKPELNPSEQLLQVPPKMKTLPSFSESISSLQPMLRALELELAEKKKRLEEVRRESDDILVRKDEVQQLLNEAGQTYAAAVSNLAPVVSATQSPARQITNAGASDLKLERGLESLGTTPNERPDVEDA